jgi:hypothetical protein
MLVYSNTEANHVHSMLVDCRKGTGRYSFVLMVDGNATETYRYTFLQLGLCAPRCKPEGGQAGRLVRRQRREILCTTNHDDACDQATNSHPCVQDGGRRMPEEFASGVLMATVPISMSVLYKNVKKDVWMQMRWSKVDIGSTHGLCVVDSPQL